MTMDRAVVGGEKHGNTPALRLTQGVPQGRALEPGPREIAERGGVAGHLEESGVLRAPVGELIDEVEHERRYAVLRQVGRQPLEQSFSIGCREDLFVVDGYRSAGELAHLLAQ